MAKNKDEIRTNSIGLFFIALLSIILVIGLWILNYIYLKDQSNESKEAFGNMFGPINALFSGLAFAGIIITIILQSNELALQRLELKDTREELKRSADAQEKSEEALFKQAENLKISAKLTALNTLVTFYTENLKELNNGINHRRYSDVLSKRDLYVSRIEEILQRKENN